LQFPDRGLNKFPRHPGAVAGQYGVVDFSICFSAPREPVRFFFDLGKKAHGVMIERLSGIKEPRGIEFSLEFLFQGFKLRRQPGIRPFVGVEENLNERVRLRAAPAAGPGF